MIRVITIVGAEYRLCSRCGDVQPISEFATRGTICSTCKSNKTQLRGAAKRMSEDLASLRTNNKDKIVKLRTCRRCTLDRKPDEFAASNSVVCVYCKKKEMEYGKEREQFLKDDANYRLLVATQEETKANARAQAAREREYAERKSDIPVITEAQQNDIQAMIDDINKPKRKDYSGR